MDLSLRRSVRPIRRPTAGTLVAGTILAASLALSGAAGAAEDWPDLRGTWSGPATAVMVGATPYRPSDQPGVQFGNDEIVFTYEITEQQGNRFAGRMSSGNRTETIIGGLRANRRDGMMLDDDGYYDLTVTGPDTMDLCYGHNQPGSRVVACWTVTRER